MPEFQSAYSPCHCNLRCVVIVDPGSSGWKVDHSIHFLSRQSIVYRALPKIEFRFRSIQLDLLILTSSHRSTIPVCHCSSCCPITEMNVSGWVYTNRSPLACYLSGWVRGLLAMSIMDFGLVEGDGMILYTLDVGLGIVLVCFETC